MAQAGCKLSPRKYEMRRYGGNWEFSRVAVGSPTYETVWECLHVKLRLTKRSPNLSNLNHSLLACIGEVSCNLPKNATVPRSQTLFGNACTSSSA
jgi:hypothetical protein